MVIKTGYLPFSFPCLYTDSADLCNFPVFLYYICGLPIGSLKCPDSVLVNMNLLLSQRCPKLTLVNISWSRVSYYCVPIDQCLLFSQLYLLISTVSSGPDVPSLISLCLVMSPDQRPLFSPTFPLFLLSLLAPSVHMPSCLLWPAISCIDSKDNHLLIHSVNTYWM